MRKPTRISWVILLGVGGLATDAVAQLDVAPSQPNVLLLVDNSGSMEWKSSSNTDPVCDPLNPNTATVTPNEKSRWTELVESLTGTINNYSCYAEPRTIASGFRDEYELSVTDPPYDLGYTESYHRPMSGACAAGPGVMPPQTSPYTYPAGAIAYRPYQGTGITLNPASPCNFSQANDGLLDAWSSQIRFGLMTFDPQPDPGTGIRTDGSADYVTGRHGTWSYYYGTPGTSCNAKALGSTTDCGATAGCCVGGPWDCTSPLAYEVGARNAGAPPAEGRLVAFGPPSDNGVQRDQWIQEILLATRPYSATPIAGMMSDARDFLWYDATPNPSSPAPPIAGPGLLAGGGSHSPSEDLCTSTYIVLLTDGEPNMDLRNAPCQKGGIDKCPYDTPENIANSLVTNPDNPVQTFVVGFAVGQATVSHDGGTSSIDCSTMDLSTCNPLPTDPTLHACCQLNTIAYNGTPVALRGTTTGSPPVPQDHAFFPQNALALRSTLGAILQNVKFKTSSRTYPITTTAPPPPTGGAVTAKQAVGYEFDSGTVVQNTSWKGILTRRQITCDTSGVASVQDPDPTGGDDFIANVNKNTTQRTIFTVQPDKVGATNVRQPTYSIRPYFPSADADGVGIYSGTQTAYDDAPNFPTDVVPESLALPVNACGTSVSNTTCSAELLSWIIGLPSAAPQNRCPGGNCNAIGDVFHSLPQVRPGLPSDFLRDSNYSDFAAGLSKRDTLLYVSTNDGFLHAFTVTPGDSVNSPPSRKPVTGPNNNEQWAFIPPAVLPSFLSMYSGAANPNNPVLRIPVLDGTPVIKDVGVTQGGTNVLDTTTEPYLFERKKAPNTSQGESHTFRTIMVQAYGHNRGGYFAVDITKPSIDSTNPNTTGPRFLWQLSTDTSGNQLFGGGSSTPLITTIFMKTKSSPEPNREVAVAVLPGGIGDAPTSATATCDADASSAIKIDGTAPSAFRANVRCYDVSGSSKNSVAARSLTIVRLDTGEIVRTFRPVAPTNTAQPVTFPTGANGVLTDYTWTPTGTKVGLNISAPISGQPVAFPADTGTVADRIFVGDEEGRIWRVDVSNPDPSLWSMNVFYDPFTDSGAGMNIGAPIQNAPVVSVDSAGQITLAFSTGDQDNLAPDQAPLPANTVAQNNYVASVTESVTVASDGTRSFQSKLNWRYGWQGGERVMGPLTLFNKELYFSSFLQAQPTSNSCKIGDSTIWGVDYVKPASTSTPYNGGLIQTPGPGIHDTTSGAGVLVPGVALRQLPSCTTGVTSSSGSDGFLGYGSMTQTTTNNPGTFQLVFVKGGTASTGVVNNVSTQTIALAPPRTPVRIDSWAPIIE